MIDSIAHYGYPLLYLGAIIEGETFLLVAAMLAAGGQLAVMPVIGVAMAGALSGDILFFAIGRRYATAFLDRRPRWQKRLDRVLPLLERFRIPLIIGFRFWYGMRAVIPLAFGMSACRTIPYVMLNILGAFVWAVVVCGLGFWLGDIAGPIMIKIKTCQVWLVLAVTVGAAGFWWWTGRRTNSPRP